MITYVEGDATLPQGEGRKIIAHICNNVGAWGAGFVMALSARDKWPETSYRAWQKGEGGFSAETFRLGEIQLVSYNVWAQPRTWVCNMIAQEGTHWKPDSPPIRYAALAMCLERLNVHAQFIGASVHMPRIGCGLAGGKWELVEPLIRRSLKDVPVTVYDLP